MPDPIRPAAAPAPAWPADPAACAARSIAGWAAPSDPAARAARGPAHPLPYADPRAPGVVVLAADPMQGPMWAVSFSVDGVVYHDVFHDGEAHDLHGPRQPIRVMIALCAVIYD